MMFEVMAFKFCPIHIKHQTFNFKLKSAVFMRQRFFCPLYSPFGRGIVPFVREKARPSSFCRILYLTK